jgi:hypothetical protein
MKDIVVLEWTYSPPNYFEEPIHISRNEYEMIIDHGRVEAKIKPESYDKNHKMRETLQAALNDRFLGVQLLTHKPYELSKASMYRLHPDGRKDITIFPNPCIIRVSTSTPDIVIKDKNGNITSNSRKDRIEKKREIADLAEKYRAKDTIVASLLNSYKSAVNDPDNELVHLYEIRDTLSTKFGDEAQVRNTLGVSSSQWSRFGRMANYEPVKQGRHRGKSAGTLRDATKEELKEARAIARNLVWSYLNYLEKQK